MAPQTILIKVFIESTGTNLNECIIKHHYNPCNSGIQALAIYILLVLFLLFLVLSKMEKLGPCKIHGSFFFALKFPGLDFW